MATLKVQIRNSRFIDYSGVEVKLFTPSKIKGNGWECCIDDKGNITCIAQQYYSGVRHTVKFTIKNSWVKLLLKVGDEKNRAIKSYKLESQPTDGIIGLPGGYIDKRRAYFRDAKFQEFLNEHQLTAVNSESANAIYVLHEEFYRGESIYREEIEDTDGRTELIFNDVSKHEEDEEGTFIVTRQVEVTDASWAIKKVVNHAKVQRILYTSDNPKAILNLPKK